MCDLEIESLKRADAGGRPEREAAQPPEDVRAAHVQQKPEAAPEKEFEQKTEATPEQAAEQKLDTATTDPRGFVQEGSDHQQAESIQHKFSGVADNVAVREKAVETAESAGVERSPREAGPQTQISPQEDVSVEPSLEDLSTPSDAIPATTGHLEEGPEVATGQSQAVGAAASSIEAAAQAGQIDHERLSRPLTAMESVPEQEGPLPTQMQGAAGEFGKEAGGALMTPEGFVGVPDSVSDALNQIFRGLGMRSGGGGGPAGSSGGSDSASDSSWSYKNSPQSSGESRPDRDTSGNSADDIANEVMAFAKDAFENEGPPADGDATGWVANKIADYFEGKYGDDPEMAGYIAILREVADSSAGKDAGPTTVTRVQPTDSDFMGSPEGGTEGTEGSGASAPSGGRSGDGNGGGGGGNGSGSGSGGNGSEGGGGNGSDGGGDDGAEGGGNDGDGGDDGSEPEGGDDEGGEDEGMTLDGGSGDEPGNRRGSILGGSAPSGGSETEDAGRQGPILAGGALGSGGGGEGSGSDVGGKESEPISGAVPLHPDSGGAKPIDPVRAAAQVQADQQELNDKQKRKTGTG